MTFEEKQMIKKLEAKVDKLTDLITVVLGVGNDHIDKRRVWLSTKEVAEITGKNIRTIYRYAKSGKIKSRQLSEGAAYEIHISAIKPYVGKKRKLLR